MPDWFASNAPAASGGDWFASNAAADFAKTLPPAAGPHVQMHEHNLVTGKPNPSFDNAPAGATGDLEQAAKGMVKGTYQVTVPGVAASILNKKAPMVAAKLPAVLTENAAPLEQLPGQIITTGLMGMEGGLGEADVAPGAPRPAAVPSASVPPEAVGLIRKAALKFALKKVPGAHAVNDLVQFAQDVLKIKDALGAKVEPAAAPAEVVPQTEGTPWGKPILNQPAPAAKPATPLIDSAAYTTGPRPVIQKGTVPGSKADLAESKAIEEQVRETADRENRTFYSQEKADWFARNQPGSTKGELTGAPEKPVKFTKTPGVKARFSGTTPPGTVPDSSAQLLELLRKSLEEARKQKASD